MYSIKTSKYSELLIKLLYSGYNSPNCEFLGLMLENSVNLMVNQLEFRRIAISSMNITDENFDAYLRYLRKRGEIVQKIGNTLYLHPKYKAIKESEGLFCIVDANKEE